MIEFLEETFGKKRFQITFGATADSIIINDDTTKCNFQMTDGTVKEVPYALLVGADGRNSAIRQQLASMGKLKVKQYLNNNFWKALMFPGQTTSSVPPSAFLTYPPLGQRTSTDVGVFLPRYPDKHVALMFWKRSSGNKNPFGAKNFQEFKDGLSAVLPNITDFPPDDEIDYVLNEQQAGTEMWMKVSEHAVPELGVALVGDAAHSMYSLFGQGCSCGLQGASMLNRKLMEETSMTDALAKFSKDSKKEGYAITDLNLISHWEGSKFLGRLRIWDFMKVMPMLGNVDVPYTDILKSLRWQVALSRLLWFFQRVPVEKK
jgi:2-polyprenyl-6-methoxyphenol hydroxylase-like FAD-dependent oxidoreductase